MPLPLQKYDLIGPTLGIGGLNNKVAITNLADNEAADCQNVIFDINGAIAKRRGFVRHNTTQIPGNPTLLGIFDIRLSTGGTFFYAAAGTDIWNMSVNPPASVHTGLTSGLIPDTDILNNYFFYVNGTDFNRKFDGTTWTRMGIIAPASTTVSADGGAGALTGTYRYLVTFVNSTTGHESNPNVTSTNITLGAGRQVSLTVIPTSADAQVTRRRIYRTESNGAIFFRLTEIADNVTTILTDNNLDTTLGIELEFDNDLPPVSDVIEVWKDRVWLRSGSRVVFSKPVTILRPDGGESFPATFSIDVNPDDGDTIISLKRYYNQLLVFKRHSIWSITGDDENSFVPQQIHTDFFVGAVSNRSVQVAENLCFFISTNGIYAFDGIRVNYISGKIEGFFDPSNPLATFRLNKSRFNQVDARVYKNNFRNWYVLVAPTGSSVNNDVALVYDIRLQAWMPFRGFNAHSLGLRENTTNNYSLYTGDYNGFVNLFDSTDGDGASVNGTSTGVNTGTTFNDTTQSFPVGTSHIGLTITIRGGLGAGQTRTVTANTLGPIPTWTISPAWSTIPDATSTYSVGAIDASYRSAWINYKAPDNVKRLLYSMVNATRQGNFNVQYGVAYDFQSDQASIFFQYLNLLASDARWDVALWDVATWDSVSAFIQRLRNSGNAIHVYVQFILRQQLAGQPFTVNSLGLLYQMKGIRR